MTVKSLKFFLSTLFLAVLCFDEPSGAAEMSPMEMGSSTAPVTVELTLQKAEDMALKGNPHIHAADKRVDAAGKQSIQTLAPADPTFMIDDTFANTNMWLVEENLGFPGKSF